MLRRLNGTPPNTKNPMIVWRTDFATPTRLVVNADDTEVQRNVEYIKTPPNTGDRLHLQSKQKTRPVGLKSDAFPIWNIPR